MASNPYHRYVENNLFSADPLQLVVELYRGARDAVLAARAYNSAGEPLLRGTMVTRAIDFLSELSLSLDPNAAPEISGNLKELYGYMQHVLLQAHIHQSDAQFTEVAGLLSTLMDAWDAVAQARANADVPVDAAMPMPALDRPVAAYSAGAW